MTPLSETWRYVDCGAVDAFENNATSAGSTMSTARSTSTPAGGWGSKVIRRPSAGGGTAFSARGCVVMWGVMFPEPGDHDDLDAEIARFQPVVLDALDGVGLGEVRFEGSADLRWHGRKLGGISAGNFGRVISVGGFLNIERPDLDLYQRVVRVPDDKFKDKLFKDMREYVCTAAEVAGRPVTYEQFRDALLAAVRKADVELDRHDLTDVEHAASDSGDVRARIVSIFEAPDVHQADTTTGVTTDDLLAALE
jgi:lipoate-protein ligase A